MEHCGLVGGETAQRREGGDVEVIGNDFDLSPGPYATPYGERYRPVLLIGVEPDGLVTTNLCFQFANVQVPW